MRQQEWISKMKEKDAGSITTEDCADYLKNFGSWDDEKRQRLLGWQLCDNLARAMAIYWASALAQVAKGRRNVEVFKGMYLTGKPRSAIREKWEKKVPLTMSKEDCLKVIQDLGEWGRVLK